MAKITIESEGNGVLFNGALVGKEGWVLSTSGDQSKVTLTNKITGLSGSAPTTEVEVSGSTFADYDALVAALGPILFKGAGTGPGSGVQSVTGDGVGGTATDPVLTFPTPAEIGAATTAQGAKADTAVQPGGLPTWSTISGKPAFVAEGANAAAARTALGLGTAATQASGAFATTAQGAKADTALQPAAIANMVESEQEGGDGITCNNILAFEHGTLPVTRVATTFYFELEEE